MRLLPLMACFFPMIAAAAPLDLQHSMRLLDTGGVPLNGDIPVAVTLYRDAGGTQQVWTRAYTPTFEDGFVTITLAAGTPALTTSIFAGGDVYLGVAIDGGNDLQPREHLASVPYASVASAVATSAAPGTSCPSAGELLYDTATSTLLACNGSTWQAASGGSWTAWTAVTYATQWSDLGSPYNAVQYRKRDDRVCLRGVANRSTIASNSVIFNLPSGFRPQATLLFLQGGNGASASDRVDIHEDGRVRLDNTDTAKWTSLDGICFSTL